MRPTSRQPFVLALSCAAALLAVPVSVAAQDDDATEPTERFVGYGHVDEPGYPFLITFPADWAVVEYDTAAQAEQSEQGSDLLDADAAGLSGGPALVSIHAFAPVGALDTNADSCSVEVWLSDTAPADVLERDLVEDMVALFGDLLYDGPHSAIVATPAGPTVQVDAGVTFTDGSAGAMSWYLFDDGSHYILLGCFSPDLPASDFSSIAQTFAFRPDAD